MAKHHQRKKEGESTSNGASHGRLHKGGDILGSLVVYLNISISGGEMSLIKMLRHSRKAGKWRQATHCKNNTFFFKVASQ